MGEGGDGFVGEVAGPVAGGGVDVGAGVQGVVGDGAVGVAVGGVQAAGEEEGDGEAGQQGVDVGGGQGVAGGADAAVVGDGVQQEQVAAGAFEGADEGAFQAAAAERWRTLTRTA